MKKSILYIMLPAIAAASFLSCSKSSGSLGDVISSGLSSGKVIISEVKKHSHLTLKNESNGMVNLENWKLVEIRQYLMGGSDTNTYVIPAGTLLNKGASINYSASTIGFVLGADETVYLYDKQGSVISQKSWLSFN